MLRAASSSVKACVCTKFCETSAGGSVSKALRTHASTDLDLAARSTLMISGALNRLRMMISLIPTRYESFTPKSGPSLGEKTTLGVTPS